MFMPSPRGRGHWLEPSIRHPQPQLNLPHGADRRKDLPELWRIRVGIRLVEVGVICEIEHFEAELKVPALPHRMVLNQGQVGVVRTGPDDNVPAGVAERKPRGHDKRLFIEPGDRIGIAAFPIPDQIGALRTITRIRDIGRHPPVEQSCSSRANRAHDLRHPVRRPRSRRASGRSSKFR